MLSSTKLDGIALIVGGGRGIGQQAGFSLAEAGAEVIVFADLDEESAVSTAEESKQYASNKNYRAAAFKVNVTDPDQVQSMVDFVVREFGRLDYCVNSAGLGNDLHVSVADTDIDFFNKTMDVNTKGLMLCVRAETAAMRKQEPRTIRGRTGERDIGRGAIVNVASAHSFVGLPGKMSYTVSKHAALAVTKMAGMDHASEGIRCNSVCPTWVQTPLLDSELKNNPQVQAEISAVVPIKRAAKCEEVSDAIAFLCSPASSYINGTSLVIDSAVTTTIRMH